MLVTELQTLYISFQGNYTDVTLACEGKFYPVHKLVLSTCSEYFSEIFERTPCKNPVIVLKDILCQDLEFLLDYMYIGEVNVRQNDLSSLIKAAECLKIKGLAVPDDDPKYQSNSKSHGGGSSRQRYTESGERSSPAPKRRRTEERRASSSLSHEPTPSMTNEEQPAPSVDSRANESNSNPVQDQEKQVHQTQQEKETVSYLGLQFFTSNKAPQASLTIDEVVQSYVGFRISRSILYLSTSHNNT